jgi:oligoendopeptidase F
MIQKRIPARKDVPVQFTWDTESIFPTHQAWEATFQDVEAGLPDMKRFHGHLGDGSAELLEFLAAADLLKEKVDKVLLYARLNFAIDTTNQAAAGDADKAIGLQARTAAATSFAEPEILGIGFDRLRAWMESESGLAVYAHYFERLERRAPHVRSAEVEELLSQVMDPFKTASATHGILVNADLTFTPVQVSGEDEAVELAHSNINSLMSSSDREIRRQAWENYADAHLAYKNTQASCLSAGVKQDVFFTRARGYASSLEASLGENFIPVEVFYNLIDIFKANLPTWHRYWNLRRRALGLDRLHVYDTRAELTRKMPVVPFEQAVEWVVAGLRPLGEEYVNVLRKGVLEERWVDRYPNNGKRFGAFSSGVRGTHPFVMMSYKDDIFSVSTLAHELGHSMHSYFTRRTQPQVYSFYGLFLAEVASNFNQAMVRANLLETQPDPDLQIAIIEEAMSNFHRYFFIMPTLARFELEIHERVERGEALNAQGMIDLMADLFSEGYGPDVDVDRERVGSVWMQFSTHLYSNFYVYQYATGISGAHALAEGVLSGAEPARQNYLAFLKAGGSMYPLDALRMAGVDLSTPAPVEKTFGVLASMVDRLEKLLA